MIPRRDPTHLRAMGLALIVLCLLGPATSGLATEVPLAEPERVEFTLGINLAQTVWHAVAGAAIGLTWIALPLEAQIRLSDSWGLVVDLQYRYEDYWNSGGIWNDYHEVFFLAGPRWSLLGTGLKGWFASLGVGLGYAKDPSPYECVSLAIQPEVGYAFLWGPPGLSLKLGLGLLINVPLQEDPGLTLTTIGWFAHRLIPLADVQIGFAL